MTQSTKLFHYVALGDSLANGVGGNGWGYPQQLLPLLEQHRPTALQLFATNGQTSTQLVRKQSQYRDQFKLAQLITVNIGGNDLRLTWRLYGHRATPRLLREKRMRIALTTLTNNWNELAKLITQNTSPTTKVLFINLYNPYHREHPRTRSFVAEANQLLETICANHGFEVLDARSLLNAAAKNQTSGREQLLAKDGLHLSRQGYSLLANEIHQIVYPLTIWDRLKMLLKVSWCLLFTGRP